MSLNFSKCYECKIENPKHQEDFNKIKVLLNFLPFEICEKIIKMTYKYSKCINCQKTLCESHIHIGHEPIGNFGTIEVTCCTNCKKEMEDFFF